MNHPNYITTQVVERKRRGAALLVADASNVAQVSHILYLVRGSESPDYKVTLIDLPSCECKDFERNGELLGTCKHIEAVRLFNRVYAFIEQIGDDLATMQAITGAGRGSVLRRLRWESVLSVVRFRTHHDPFKALAEVSDSVPFARSLAA